MPITIPTTAQATPTGKEALPPSASASLQESNVSLPPLNTKLIATKTDIEITITFIPISKNEAETKPSKTQNITLLYFDKVPAIGAPRIKNTINARPIVPAYKGV